MILFLNAVTLVVLPVSSTLKVIIPEHGSSCHLASVRPTGPGELTTSTVPKKPSRSSEIIDLPIDMSNSGFHSNGSFPNEERGINRIVASIFNLLPLVLLSE